MSLYRDPAYRRTRQISVAFLAAGVTLFVAIATIMAPTWQRMLAVTCLAGIVPIMWIGIGRRPIPFDPATPPREHLASIKYPLAAMALFALAWWLLMSSP